MGSGYRTFTAGEVLTASNVQNYLQDQAVMVFAGTAARSSAIGTANFEEGMLTYLTDVDKLQVYTGASFADVYPPSASTQGLTVLSRTDFSAGVSSVTLNNVFSNSYRNYRIIISNLGGSGAIQALLMRLRKSGTDNTSNIYYRQNVSASSTTVTAGRSQSTSWTIGGVRDQGPMSITMDIFSPQVASQKTNALGTFMQNSTSEPELISNGWQHDLASSADFDGFTIFPSSGSIYGYLYVFGYNGLETT